MIIFNWIRWKNLLATGNYWTRIQLDAHQNTLIVGKNGSGKSTLLDALCFALFGKPFRKINKPTLVNSINKGQCVVELAFQIDTVNYRIVRGISPTVFEIYKNEEPLDEESATRDFQEYLEQFILKFNMKSFTQIVILGSASFTPFMQLSAADRRLIIEDLLDIQIFSTMHGLAKDHLALNKTAISETKMKYTSTLEKKDMLIEHIKNLQTNKDHLLDSYTKELEQYRVEQMALTLSIEKTEKKIITLTDQLKDQPALTKKIRQLVQLEAKISQNVTKQSGQKDFFSTTQTCPTCTQDISETFKKEKVQTIEEKLQALNEGMVALQTKLQTSEQLHQVFLQVEKTIQSNREAITGWRSKLQEVTRQVTRLEEKKSSLDTSIHSTDKEEAQLLDLEKEIEGLSLQLKTLSEEKQYLETATVLLKDTGIKTQIVRQYLPIINSLTNKYLALLDFFVNFQLDENFKETIRSRYRDEFSYHSFSEGQKMRIDMSLMLTWRGVAKLKNSIDTNLLILDEIFDSSLDATGADELMKVLHLIEGNNIFVISHRGDILQDKFAHTLQFTEQQNFSYLNK